MSNTKRINLYPGLFPRRSNWADLQDALFTNIDEKWSLTKNYGVVSGLDIIDVDLPGKKFGLDVGVAFDRTGDEIELDSAGAALQYDISRASAVDNQFPPQSIAQSTGAKDIPMETDTGIPSGAPVDTYVFIQSLETIDLTATNRFRVGRIHQYPKIDFGYKVFTKKSINDAIASINTSQNTVFLGVIRIEGTNATVLPAFTTTGTSAHPIDPGFAYFQIPRLLGNDSRDLVGGSKHDHLGPYVKGRFFMALSNTAVRIRVLDDLTPTDYDDFFIGSGSSDQAKQNAEKYLTKSTYAAGNNVLPTTAYEFAVPVGRFQGKRIRVMLSSTGFFSFPDFPVNFPGTPDSRTGLSPAQLALQNNVFWDDIRLEPDKDLPGDVETVFLPNNKFEYFTSKGAFGTGTLLADPPGADCDIPGWTLAAGSNLPNRMILVSIGDPAYPVGFTGAGPNVLCTYSNAQADTTTTTLGKSGTRFGAGGNAQQYTVVDVPYTGLNREAQEQEDASTDYDNRHTANPTPVPGTVSQQGINGSVDEAISSNVPDNFGSVATRGWTSVTVFTRNKWSSLSRHFQHLWARLLDHDHSALSGCQQVVTEGVADGAITFPKLTATLSSGVGPALVPVGMICFVEGPACPSGWLPYSQAFGRFLVGANISGDATITPGLNKVTPQPILSSLAGVQTDAGPRLSIHDINFEGAPGVANPAFFAGDQFAGGNNFRRFLSSSRTVQGATGPALTDPQTAHALPAIALLACIKR